jgi:hypothetical protein
MSKNSVIEQLRKRGVVAAHPDGRWVDTVKGIPVKATFKIPLMQDHAKIKKGDKVAILSSDQNFAYVCRVKNVEIAGLGTPVLELENQKLVDLD